VAVACKTVRQRLEHRPGISDWFADTRALFNQVAQFYFQVIQAHPELLALPNKAALTALEKLTHKTKANPDPAHPLEQVSANIPACFRRAAINAALGAARSFHANLERWRRRKEKAAARGKQFRERPPVPPRVWARSVTFYAGMWKEWQPGRIVLKLWDGRTWRWVRFRISGRELPEGWQAKSPQVVRRGRRWWLHVPVEKRFPQPTRLEEQVQSNLGLRLCAVDLNTNDVLAACVILKADGTAVASRFVRGGRKLHGRRKRLLGMVARNRSRTGIIAEGEQDNAALWRKIRALDENEAHRVSRRIVEFALAQGARVIVFEHLGAFRPAKGRYSRRANERRSYWLRGRIVRYTRYKAREEGLLVSRVNPADTSRLCARCGEELSRYSAGQEPGVYCLGAPLVHCPSCGMKGNAERNAALNIGRKLFARYEVAKPATGTSGCDSPKGEGVPVSQGAARHGDQDGHGTARGIPRFLRSQRSGGYAASTPGCAHAGVPEEAALL